jgi:peptidoglycan/xylan/chitin deacetylase (PgdA/CDA1 family)
MKPCEFFSGVLTGVRDHPRAAWAEGMTLHIPRSLLADFGLSPDRADTESLPASAIAATAQAVERLRRFAAFTPEPPVSGRLGFSYRRIPPWARTIAASLIGRVRRRSVRQWACFPGWPLDLGADALADLVPDALPAPAGLTPVVLSHDLDSEEGLHNFLGHFAALEEAVGARSVNFVVPCSWPLDHGLLAQVQARGHELGIHGFDHSNRTPFVAPAERALRVARGRELADRYGMQGYRAPSLLRTPALYRELAGRYAYDSSIPSSGGLFPVPNNGCASARPLAAEGVAVLPLSMPRDGSLLFLGHRPEEILALWTQCAALIRRSGGVVVLLTHCENRFSGNPVMRDVYARFLKQLAADDGYAFRMPLEVLGAAGAGGR